MKFKSIAEAKRQTGLSYLGSVNLSAKHQKNYDMGEMVYALYLAPAEMSGYNVCPKSNAECRFLCLNESGQNKIQTKTNNINKARIIKTKLFFEEREFFMQWLIADIKASKLKADKTFHKFSIRLNNTSDINPEQFQLLVDGKMKNILEIFPDIQFYDYTKVDNRKKLLDKYKNYDITFSYDGYNWDICEKMINDNIRVAVVFKKELPLNWNGIEVINGDLYDVRYHDEKNVIVGLKFKQVRNKLQSNMKFVVQ